MGVSDDSSSMRKALTKVLSGDAMFLRVQSDSKLPVSSFSVGKRNRLKHVPSDGNFGVIPQNNLFILDFDNHQNNGSSVDDQIAFFSAFLGLDIRTSLMVMTPNGGAHAYLRFPNGFLGEQGVMIPKGSLRGYSGAFSHIAGKEIDLDADIKTSLSNGYAIGLSSVIEDKSYFPVHGVVSAIKTISDEAAQKFVEVMKIHKKSVYSDVQKYGMIENHHSMNLHQRPNGSIVKKLSYALQTKNIDSFHRKRAFVKSALQCCYDDYSIGLVCIELGINRDSYRGHSLAFSALVKDLKRFSPDHRFHGKYCALGNTMNKANSEREYAEEFDLEKYIHKVELLKKNRALSRVKKSSYRVVNPRVLDVGKISETISGDSRKKKPSQQYYDCLAIVDYFLQPLSNVGNSYILLAYSALSDKLNISKSRVSQAMRVLRQKGIIVIEQKQRTGLAATYSVPEFFTHSFLTKSLKIMWANSPVHDKISHDSLYFDRRSGNFHTVFGGIVYESPEVVVKACSMMNDSMVGECFYNFGAGAASSYLREERFLFERRCEHFEELEKSLLLVDYDTLVFVEDNAYVNPITGEFFFSSG